MMAPGGSARRDCAEPIEPAVLMDYWLAALSADAEGTVEAHLLSCDACGDRLRETIALAEHLRTLARSGLLLVVLNDTLVQQIKASGARVREYAPPRGGSIPCTVAADDDFLLGHLAADLAGAGRIDISLCNAWGIERQRLADIPLRPDADSVIVQHPIGWAKAAGDDTQVARLIAVDADGTERLIGEYTFNHTRTIPGPPTWSS